MSRSDWINFHFYFVGTLDSRWQLSAAASNRRLFSEKKSRFHGNSCHSCYAVEISRTCQLRELWKSKFFRLRPLHCDFIVHVLARPNFCPCVSLYFAHFCAFLLHFTYVSSAFFYNSTYFFMRATLDVHVCIDISVPAPQKHLPKNRLNGVNRFRREAAIDDIGSSSELVCRLRAWYIIESNFAMKSVSRPKLRLMTVQTSYSLHGE